MIADSLYVCWKLCVCVFSCLTNLFVIWIYLHSICCFFFKFVWTPWCLMCSDLFAGKSRKYNPTLSSDEIVEYNKCQPKSPSTFLQALYLFDRNVKAIKRNKVSIIWRGDISKQLKSIFDQNQLMAPSIEESSKMYIFIFPSK